MPASRELRREIAPCQVAAAVCEAYGAPEEALRTRGRRGGEARPVALYLCKRLTRVSLSAPLSSWGSPTCVSRPPPGVAFPRLGGYTPPKQSVDLEKTRSRQRSMIVGPSRTLCLATAYLLVNLASAPAGQAIRIVEEGQPRATIVVPGEPSDQVRDAAALVAQYVKESSGAQLPIAREGQTQQAQGALIHVGPCTERSGSTTSR